VQAFPARPEHRNPRGDSEQPGELRSHPDDCFQVVEHEQDLAACEVLGEVAAHAERAGDRRYDERGIADNREIDEPHAVREVPDELGPELESEPRLSDPARARQGDEPRSAAHEPENVGELLLAADQGLELKRQVRVVQALERWKGGSTDLVQPDRLAEILEPVLAEIAEVDRRVEQVPRRLREENLTAVRDGGDPRRAHDVDPDVAVTGEPRLAGVDPDPDPERGRRERILRLPSRRDGVTGARECDEERVSLRIDLDARVARHHLPKEPAVLRQHLPVGVAELAESPGRTFDIREEERDGATRKLAHATMMERVCSRV
jgi:hypothetical protein